MAKTGWRIEVTGLRQLINALDEIDKGATRKIRAEITSVANAVKVNAAGRVTQQPLGNWGKWTYRGRDLNFDTGAVSAGFKVQRNNFRKRGVSRGFGVDVRQASAAGSIFEVIGDKSRVSGPKGEQFVDSIVAKGGLTRPRSLLPAYYSAVTPDVQERIRDQIISEAKRLGLT